MSRRRPALLSWRVVWELLGYDLIVSIRGFHGVHRSLGRVRRASRRRSARSSPTQSRSAGSIGSAFVACSALW